MMEPWEVASYYHEATEHHYHRSARSLGYMDWSNQPNPFRRYRGTTSYQLELADDDEGPAYDSLFDPVAIASQGVDRHSLSLFMRYSLAISAWKEFGGSRWALRVNPSSGNLHPTEAYLICGPIEGLCDKPMVCHYAPKEHGLEVLAEFELELSWLPIVGQVEVFCNMDSYIFSNTAF